MKKIILWGISLMLPCAYAADIDTLLAKTSIALGDEYLKVADEYRLQLKEILKLDPNLEDSDNVSEYNEIEVNYESYKSLAMDEYSLVFCETSCPDYVDPLVLPSNYQYLLKEAFNKYEYTERDFGLEGTISKYAPIYAVNSNFEEQIVSRVTKIIEEQTSLDSQAREINNTFRNLDSSYIDLESSEITGVDQALLKEDNYDKDNQIQIENYQSCIDNAELNLSFEKDEMEKMWQQYDILNSNLANHFEKVYDYSYSASGGEQYFEISAGTSWQNTTLTFSEGDSVYFEASGEWLVGSPVYAARSKGLFDFAVEAFTSYTGAGFAMGILGEIAGGPKGYSFSDMDIISNIIITKKKKTDANGYMFSNSDGMSEGSSSGSSAGLSFCGASVGTSTGSSSGISHSVSATLPLYLSSAISSELTVGSLIGSFCDTDPQVDSNCEVFLVGKSSFRSVDMFDAGKKLWLVANNALTNFQYDDGSMQVKISRKEQFKSWWNQYVAWVAQECDENGENCGLKDLIENIAFSPNPYALAKSMIVKEFPDMPVEARSLILEEINYIIEMKMLGKNIKAKELSWELNTAKVGNCENQLDLSMEKLDNTRDIIKTYSALEQNIETKKILLETSRRYYEEELEAINAARLKNLDRLRRYFDIAVKSFNYLYLTDYSATGTIQQYREGQYYEDNIERMKDQVFEITSTNDLLNPNSGFVVYELSSEDLSKLQNSDFRQREALIRLDMNEFFCKGFNLASQARVSIEKMGVLLDIDPANEYQFFKNTHTRSTNVMITHGSENRLYDFLGFLHEYWMPAQKRGIKGISSRVLLDHNSDYYDLKNSSYFERESFRKMSMSSSWKLELKDPAIRMYLSSDTEKENPLLQGVKLVFWYKSAEINGTAVNQCLIPPYSVEGTVDVSNKPKVDWKTPVDDYDYDNINSFFVYRSTTSDKGFSAISEIDKSDCTINGDDLECSFIDSEVVGTAGDTFYYHVRAAHLDLLNADNMMKGIESDVVEVTLP